MIANIIYDVIIVALFVIIVFIGFSIINEIMNRWGW